MNDKPVLFGDGAAYEISMGQWSRRVGEQFLDWLAAPQGLDWLDAGCGNGAFTETIMGKAAPLSVCGIDPSAAQVAYASDRPGCKGAQFRTGDVQALPYEDKSFDVAVMGLVISFIPDPEKAIAELARVTRPGGLIGTYMWNSAGGGGHPAWPLNAALKDMGRGGQGAPYGASARRERMFELWTGAGLADVETREIELAVRFADFDDFWRSNTVSTGPLGARLQALTGDEMQALQQRLRETLPRDDSGAIAYSGCANAVKGRLPG